MTGRVLPVRFFYRPAAEVARDLLGAVDDRGEGPVEVEERSGSRRVDREWCRDAEDLARAREGGGHRAL